MGNIGKKAPEAKAKPEYISMFPRYKGFLILAYGPDVTNSGAPTERVRVEPPACRIDVILTHSPEKEIIKPKIRKNRSWLFQ